MASSNRRVPGVALMILMLLMTQSPRTTDGFSCKTTCILACIFGPIASYPSCAANCYHSDCEVEPSPSEEKLMQCETGCVMTTCMRRNRGPNDEKTKQCVVSCSDGCEKAYLKNGY